MEKILSDDKLKMSKKTFVEKGSLKTIDGPMTPEDVRDHYESLRSIGELFTKDEVIRAMSTLLFKEDVESCLTTFRLNRDFLMRLRE